MKLYVSEKALPPDQESSGKQIICNRYTVDCFDTKYVDCCLGQNPVDSYRAIVDQHQQFSKSAYERSYEKTHNVKRILLSSAIK